MNYDIIKIVQTRFGEVAYLFDKQRGRVMKVLVDDYTTQDKPARPQYDNPDPGILEPRDFITPEMVDMLPDPVENRAPAPYRPQEKKKSIMPPHLRGVFVDADTPGSAVEKRVV